MNPRGQSKPRWFRRHPRLAMLATVIVVTLVADVILGTAFAAVGLRVGARKHTDYFRQPHPVLHHGFQPNISFDGALWGRRRYHIYTNSLAFKDSRVREIPLKSDKKRLLFVGDSFTEGIGVEYAKTFVGLVDDHFAPQGIEVMNAGVYSYAPILYLRLVQHLFDTVGLEVDHVFVFIDYSDVNDEANLYEFDTNRNVIGLADDEPSVIIKRFLSNNTILINSIRTLVRNIKRRVNPPDMSWERAFNQTEWSYDETTFEKWGRKGLTRATQHMDELAAFLKKKNVPLTIGIYPWPDQIIRRDAKNRHRTHWRKWAARHDLKVIDCFPAFLEDDRDPETVIREQFMSGDFHWNEKGHAVMARTIIAHLERWQ